MNWSTPIRPAQAAEERLIEAILEGRFPISSVLPAERELAIMLGVTRPTLREALQRLARDGWIEIRQGKPTRVRDYWREGSLGVLSALALHPKSLPDDFVSNLLQIRSLLAPTYTRLAIERHPEQVIAQLIEFPDLPDQPNSYAEFDWNVHHCFTQASENPIFTLILNGFRHLYPAMAGIYFQNSAARASSKEFYATLLATAQSGDASQAEQITIQVMKESLHRWQALTQKGDRNA
jgi:GntR family negative regulator for fad regulon and positive regulator of fabA